MHEKSKILFSYMLYAYSVKEPIGELNLKRACIFAKMLVDSNYVVFA